VGSLGVFVFGGFFLGGFLVRVWVYFLVFFFCGGGGGLIVGGGRWVGWGGASWGSGPAHRIVHRFRGGGGDGGRVGNCLGDLVFVIFFCGFCVGFSRLVGLGVHSVGGEGGGRGG